jgi:two-component system heavy metal sensor histidine kinase CusS
MESNLEEYERLSQLVEKLVFLARADNNNIEIERHEILAGDELRNILELYQGIADESDITLSCTGDAPLYVDPVLFRRAATNLVANSIKYTPPGGSVNVSCSQQNDGSVDIVVADTGYGIPAEDQVKIFDRFYRATNTQHLHSKSTGLGLTIAKSIVTIHGGSIDLQSEPDKGTRITLHFPSQHAF